ncbi:MAG: hypothetical protein CMD26_05630 [Flavobacteriales bacterium]|nr:hypothetical protein [Flavobacteriales bacterium]|tara:strand:- start:16140 stop:16370 length:231 start_codon:yes stop_codon:yes gene_type:complete
MKKILEKIKGIITQGIELAVPFLCLGVVIQLITGSPLLGWNVVGNISNAIGQFGQANFIGVAALLILYSYINKSSK